MEVVDVALEQFPYRSDFYLIKARLFLADNKIDLLSETIERCWNCFSLRERKYCCSESKPIVPKNIKEAKFILEDLKSTCLEGDLIDYFIAESYFSEASKEYKAMYSSLKQALKIDSGNAEALERFWVAVDFPENTKTASLSIKAISSTRIHTNHLAWYNLGLSLFLQLGIR